MLEIAGGSRLSTGSRAVQIGGVLSFVAHAARPSPRSATCSTSPRKRGFAPAVLAVVALAVAALGGCTAVENAPAPELVQTLDEPFFHCAVEPILLRECAYNGCHGQASAPLRLYSLGKLRLGPSATLADRTVPLTDAERHLNYLGAQAFDFGGVAPEDNLLLRKPMPSSAGGYEHEGGAIWSGSDDARVRTIRNWLEGGTQCPQ
jgi:hypothetical protein